LKIFSDIANAIASLPGVIKSDFYYKISDNDNTNFCIYFYLDMYNIESHKGLFFLTRCTSGRYWHKGYKWKIQVGCNNTRYSNTTGVVYSFYNNEIIKKMSFNELKTDLESLLKNMNYHLNDKRFLKEFDLNIDMFDLLPIRNLIIETK